MIGLQFFFLGVCRADFFYSNVFSEGEGGELKLGLYVFHHHNNFDLINI